VIARTYEEPDAQGAHVLFTHPYTSLRMLDPFDLVCSSKGVAWAFPDLNLDGPYRMRALREQLAAGGGFNGQMLEWAVELEAILVISALEDPSRGLR
jgi:hypothetical protein